MRAIEVSGAFGYNETKRTFYNGKYAEGGIMDMKVVIIGGVAGGATAAARIRRLRL